ncbi:hypothetical protein K502DRAFT_329063 [Neoconidiobolus thromboides FSU 785]|nr:hypothetical protein K502DRAFT_329063 [Neoconidiobolus thromboides FSU 785]
MSEPFKISGDRLVKSLKGSSLSNTQKIEIAEKVLQDPTSTTLQNLDTFLLEWNIQLISKSTIYHTTYLNDTPYLSIRYWSFFTKLLMKLNEENKELNSFDKDIKVKNLFSKLPIVTVITSTIKYIIKELNQEYRKEEIEIYQQLLVLSTKAFSVCFNYLEAMNSDGLIKLYLECFLLFDKVIEVEEEEFNLKEKLQFLASIIELLIMLSGYLIKLINWSPTYKKLFQTVVDQLLITILKCQFQLNKIIENNLNENENENIILLQGKIKEFLSISLFHPSYLIDYGTIYSSELTQSYRQLLFEKIKKSIEENNNNTNPTLLLMLPQLIDLFIKKNPNRPAVILEFSFILQLLKVIINIKIESNNNYKTYQIISLSKIIEKIAYYELYQPTNDIIKQQQMDILQQVKQIIFSYDINDDVNLPSLIKAYTSFVKIDYLLVQQEIPKLWELVLYPTENIQQEASELALALIKEYHDARLWEVSFNTIINTSLKYNIKNEKQGLQSLFYYGPFIRQYKLLLKEMNSIMLNGVIIQLFFKAIVDEKNILKENQDEIEINLIEEHKNKKSKTEKESNNNRNKTINYYNKYLINY